MQRNSYKLDINAEHNSYQLKETQKVTLDTRIKKSRIEQNKSNVRVSSVSCARIC